jgi:hypothetical protein
MKPAPFKAANGLLNLEVLRTGSRELGYVERGSTSMKTLYSILSAIVAFILFTSPLAAQAGTPWDRKFNDSHRFKVLDDFGDAAVLDRETGLVWERSPDLIGYSWVIARGICIDKNVGGRKGWRLPSVPEQASLVDPNNVDPAFVNPALPPGHPFSNVHAFSYWSATTLSDPPTHAWNVFFGDGLVFAIDKAAGSFHWCVRGGMNADQY